MPFTFGIILEGNSSGPNQEMKLKGEFMFWKVWSKGSPVHWFNLPQITFCACHTRSKTSVSKHDLVSQGKRILALACASLRGAWFQSRSLFYRAQASVFPPRPKTAVLQGPKPPILIGVGSKQFESKRKKRRTNLETKLFKVRHMSRQKFFYFSSPKFVSKPAFSSVWLALPFKLVPCSWTVDPHLKRSP